MTPFEKAKELMKKHYSLLYDIYHQENPEYYSWSKFCSAQLHSVTTAKFNLDEWMMEVARSGKRKYWANVIMEIALMTPEKLFANNCN